MKHRLASRGFTLIELMVSLAIGLVLVLVVSTMVARQEDLRRGVSSGNELSNNVAYSSFLLDRELRNAGAGLVGMTNWGCPLVASLNNAQLLPSLQPFPDPFAAIPQTYVIAPLIVFAGAGANGSDVLMVSTGNSGLSETAQAVVPQSAALGQVQLSNTLGMRGGDLVVLIQGTQCMLQQVSTGFVGGATPTLTFGGSYAANTIAGVALTSFGDNNKSGTTYLSDLGNVTGNRPRFQLLGLNAGNQLVTYDLLQLTGTAPMPLIEGVMDLRVLYGVDSTGNRLAVDTWASPTANGYTSAALTNGTSTAQSTLGNILAVHVGLIIRSDQPAKNDVTAGSLTLFSDLQGGTLAYTYNIPQGTTNQRYRAVEFTVPMRNARF